MRRRQARWFLATFYGDRNPPAERVSEVAEAMRRLVGLNREVDAWMKRGPVSPPLKHGRRPRRKDG